MADLQTLIDEGLKDASILTNGPASVACFDTLFGPDQGLDEAMCQILFGGDNPLFNALLTCVLTEIQDEIKQAIIDCITDPDASPISKDLLGDVIQGNVEDGPLGAAEEGDEGPFVFTTDQVAIHTTTSSAIKLQRSLAIKGGEVIVEQPAVEG